MDAVEAKLAAWSGLYSQLKAARARLKEAQAPGIRIASQYELEVLDLQRKCGIALDELNAEYAKNKPT